MINTFAKQEVARIRKRINNKRIINTHYLHKVEFIFIMAHSMVIPNDDACVVGMVARNMRTSISSSQTYVHLVIDNEKGRY